AACASASAMTSSAPGHARRASIVRTRARKERRRSSRASTPSSERVVEERHGSAGALRTLGAWGPFRGPHVCRLLRLQKLEERHGSAGGAPNAGGLGAISWPPSLEDYFVFKNSRRSRLSASGRSVPKAWPPLPLPGVPVSK